MSYRDLLPHEQIFVDRLSDLGYKINRTDDECIRSNCPAHEGENENLTAYLNKGLSIALSCHSKKCTHAEILDALDLTQEGITPSYKGLTLSEYAAVKKLPPSKLADYRVRQIDRYKYPHLEFDHFDFDGLPAGSRYRKAMHGKHGKVQHQKGNVPRLYGMWRHKEFSDYLVIVEGESDTLTLWSHGIGAVGVPGAGMVKRVLPDLEELANRCPNLQIYVFQETDIAAYNFVNAFEAASFKDRIKVVALSDFKDASELHCHNPEMFIAVWQKALHEALPWPERLKLDEDKPLASLRPMVKKSLNRGLSNEDRDRLIARIGDFLIHNGRLLIDTATQGDRTPYIIADNYSVVRIEKTVQHFRFCLQDCGISPNDEIFDRLTNDLKHRADREGKEVKLKHFSEIKDYKILYLSSGLTRMIVAHIADDGNVTMKYERNGKNGILFSAEHTFPEWSLMESISPEKFALLNPYLEAPDESPKFTPKHQVLLLKVWLVGVFAGIKVPVLTCTGPLDSGKSKTLEGIARLFVSDIKGVSNVPSKDSDFYTAITSRPVYLIDNMDGKQEKWFPNALATAATGGDVDQREYYTTADLGSRRIVARLGVTTRDHVFASGRPDIQSRLLPLFFVTVGKEDQKDENELFRQVYEHRSNIFTCLAECAAYALLDGKVPTGFNSRFQSFGKIVESLAEYEEEGIALNECKMAISFCISSEGNNGLMKGVRLYFDMYNGRPLQGTASEIANELKKLDRYLEAELTAMSPRHISNSLREIMTSLKTLGYATKESNRGNTKWYSISKVG